MKNDARCTPEIKPRISMSTAVFNKKENLSTSKSDFNLRKNLVQCHTWSTALYSAETWALRKIVQKYFENFEIWCPGRMEIIN
jgi:hypothetical protein